MGLRFAENTRLSYRNYGNLLFRTSLLLAVPLVGCGSTCFTFISNPPNGTLNLKAGDLSPTCRLTKANGVVRVEAHKTPVCGSCPDSGRVQHLFVTIRGIAVHPSTSADLDSPDWQELLPPEFVNEPLQVDLVRGTADQDERLPLAASVAIPAGIYRQVRLRFVPNHSFANDLLSEKNACGSEGFNCLVMADGRVQPLLLEGLAPEIRILSDKIEGGSLLILPDTGTDLLIEWKLVWAWSSSADDGVRLLPVLTGSVKVGRIAFDKLGAPEKGVVNDSL